MTMKWLYYVKNTHSRQLSAHSLSRCGEFAMSLPPGTHYTCSSGVFVSPPSRLLPAGPIIAKSRNPTTFAKRQREHEKKRKALEKLQRRESRKSTVKPDGAGTAGRQGDPS
jgi:hypothetical protein